MNKLLGSIINITEHDSLLLIDIKVDSQVLTSILIKFYTNKFMKENFNLKIHEKSLNTKYKITVPEWL